MLVTTIAQKVCRGCGLVLETENSFIEQRGVNVGLFCKGCGRWYKWLSSCELAAFPNTGNLEIVKSQRQQGTAFNGICRKCGNAHFTQKQAGEHIGKYCSQCGAWGTWVKQR